MNLIDKLKNCPIGMELDCTMYDNVRFNGVTLPAQYPIEILIPGSVIDSTLKLTEEGKFNFHSNAKCVIFPKGKTSWDDFVPPCPFKDGDIVFYNDTVAIFKEWGDETLFRAHVIKYLHNDSTIIRDAPLFGKSVRKEIRFATEEEKAKLFQAIKDKGYRWNFQANRLEKLIKPIFKKGDRVRIKKGFTGPRIARIIKDVCDTFYTLVSRGIIDFTEQDNWELVPNKFDISTLIPFESKVLVRNTKEEIWKPAIFGCYVNKKRPYYVLGGTCWKHCIPYESNTHLRGTTNDCDEYFKV